jgi:hypothetical protein
MKRIRCVEHQAKPERESLGFVAPAAGPYKGQRVDVYKRGCAGCFGTIGKEEVYIFYYELKPQQRRVR